MNERTPEEIVAAVKKAVMPQDAPEVIFSRAGWVAIRLSKDRFVLVRHVLDVNGVAPGEVNVVFHDAMIAAQRLGIITEEEADRYYDWARLESEKRDKQTARQKVERAAKELGYQLVPIKKPKPRRRR